MLNQRLLQRASPGTFHILPPLTRSLEKLHRVIDQEMYAVGAQKLIMPCLAPKQLWDSAGNNNNKNNNSNCHVIKYFGYYFTVTTGLVSVYQCCYSILFIVVCFSVFTDGEISYMSGE